MHSILPCCTVLQVPAWLGRSNSEEGGAIYERTLVLYCTLTVLYHTVLCCRFLHGLAEAIVRRGADLERTPVFKQKGTVVSTKDGSASVEAQGAVVLATNSPLNHNLLVHARQEASRTYVVCLKLPKGALR